MKRYMLEYTGGAIELPRGVTTVGRDVNCRLRFNDPRISRRHCRFVQRFGDLLIEDLDSRNGTYVNDQAVKCIKLSEGDEIRLGDRIIRVRSGDSVEGLFDAQTLGGDRRADSVWGQSPDVASKTTAKIPVTQVGFTVAPRCSECGAVVDPSDDRCPDCGHEWGAFTSRKTVIESASSVQHRLHERRFVEVPLRYSSETLEVEATTRDLSLGGVFVRSKILDSEGTSATLTILVDGGPPVVVQGTVVRIVDDDETPGMGVQFVELSPLARSWIKKLMDESARSDAEHPPP